MLPTALRIFSRTGEQKEMGEGNDASPSSASKKSAWDDSDPSWYLAPYPSVSSGPSPSHVLKILTSNSCATSPRRLTPQTLMFLPSYDLHFLTGYPPVSSCLPCQRRDGNQHQSSPTALASQALAQ